MAHLASARHAVHVAVPRRQRAEPFEATRCPLPGGSVSLVAWAAAATHYAKLPDRRIPTLPNRWANCLLLPLLLLP
eukprot:1085267-Pyramimonas_sp.AAC.1